MQGKKVREHPLILGSDDANAAPGGAAGGFGSQQKNVFQLDSAKRGKEDEDLDEEEEEDEEETKKKETKKQVKKDPLAEFLNLDNKGTDFETWEAKKLKILEVFKPQTENQEIVIGENRDRDIDRPIRLGKGRSRMDQLEKKASSRTNAGTLISARDFTMQLERLNREMKKFWEKEDKVACMRIAIQCAKLLNDVETPMFYPQKFILLTDILDQFGTLVYGRMKKLTKEHSGGKIIITESNEDEIDYSKIPDKVREICQNWFLKSACIREVLPRIYLELALVSCHRFIEKRVQKSDLIRLAKMIRGIAEPLCATYTCAYLARVGQQIDPNAKDYLLLLVELAYKHYAYAIKNGNAKLTPEQYFSLFEPTIDWLWQCVGFNADKKTFAKVFELYDQNVKKASFLKAIIQYFPSEIVASAATALMMSIKEHYTNNDEQLILIKEMGITFLRSPPKKQQSKLDFLNFGWECMNKSSNADAYMDCAIVLVEFAVKNLNLNSVNLFIKEIFKKFQDFALGSSTNDALYKKLEYLLVKVMMTAKDFSELIGFENLLGLLNYFPMSVRNKLCEMMLNFFAEHHPKLQDQFLIHSIFQIAKSLHDKIDAMSTEEEIKRISKILSGIILKIDFGKDLDKTLNVYTTARGFFINLDDVTETLIFATINLATRAHQYVKGKHNQKTLSFVKACIAYSHITIPTFESMEKQVKYFFLTAQAALLNGLIAETESLIKAVLTTLAENWDPKQSSYYCDLLQNILGFLVIVPSNPDAPPFQLAEAIMALIKDHEWGKQGELLHVKIFAGIINYLASQQQDTLPYHVPLVDSNDRIFIGNDQFKQEAMQMSDYCFDQILEIVEKLNEVKQQYYPILFQICVTAANIMISNCVYVKKTDQFINKMFKMADGYLTENNKISQEKISRNVLNTSFDIYKKKKEQQASQLQNTQQQQAKPQQVQAPAQRQMVAS